MMSTSKLCKRRFVAICGSRLLSSQTAQIPSEALTLKEEHLKLTTLPNGLIVASLENYSPITRIGVIVRAGARYEPKDGLGLTHTLRSMCGQSTKKSTVFGITRNIEYVGGKLSALTTRDHMIYVLENTRNYTDKNVVYLSDTIMSPAFKPWEISDNLYRQKTDLAFLKETPQLLLMESLHKTAFRGGLANSIYSPDFMLGKHTHEMLNKFVEQHFVSNRTAIVGTGIGHEELLELVEKRFSMSRGDLGNSGESKFVGGEIRLDTGSDITYVAVGAEGVGAKNQKELLALSLFQTLLGTGPRIKCNLGVNTKLGQAVAKATENPSAVSSFNISYADTGIFGLCIAANANDVHNVVKAAVTQLRESAKNISEQDLKDAKNNLKATTLMATENPSALVEELGAQALISGQILNSRDYERAVDSVSAQDVSSLALKIIKGKGAMASVGKLYNTPYLEDLL